MAGTNRVLVCASALTMLAAGCKTLDVAGIFSLQSDAAGRDRVVAGSLEAVAQTTQTSLTQLGFAAVMNRRGEAIYIASKTGSGSGFTVVLTREKTKDGEQTRVHVEWDGGKEDQVGFQLLSQIETAHRR